MTKNIQKMAIYESEIFRNFSSKIEKKLETGKFVFCLVSFGLTKLLTHLAPQNDPQHLSFVKDINAVGKKMTRNGRKMAKLRGCLF